MQIVKHTSNQIAATQTAANLEIAAAHAANAHAANTNRSYKNDLKLVTAFFPNFVNETFQVVTPLTATDVENFIGHLIRTGYTKNGIQQVYKPSSLAHLLNTISSTHKVSNLDSPINKAVRSIIVGYGKTLTDNKPYKQKQAKGLKGATIVKAINKDTFDTTTNRGTRDKAILLVGFTAALRRNEIASLKVSNLIFDTDGVLINLDNTKTGDRKNYVPLSSDIETCTATALKKWIAAASLKGSDYLFPTIIKGDKIDTTQHIAGETVRRILVATFGTEYSGHSLRVGAAQTAHEAGHSIDACRRLLGHSTDRQTVTYLTENDRKESSC